MNSLEAMNIEYSRSKRWLLVTFVLTAVFYVIGVLGSLSSGQWVAWWTLGAFVVQLTITLGRNRSESHYSLGESVRRAAMLQSGLGTKPSEVQVAKIIAKYGIQFHGESITFKQYYESKSEPGPTRLLEITKECAFWTGELADRMASISLWALVVALALVFLTPIAILQLQQPVQHGDLIAKIVMLSVSLWCTEGLLVQWRKYDSLARNMQRVLTDCDALASRPQIGLEAAVLLGEYNCSLSSAPVIPDFIYKLNQEKLNVAWASRNLDEAAKV